MIVSMPTHIDKKQAYSPVQATPNAFVRAIVQAYAKYGRDPAAALAHAQIAPAQWQLAHGHITALQMERLSAFAMQELDDEALGWFSQRMRWGSYGMLLRASLSAPTLDVALRRWCRHHSLVAQDVSLGWERAGTEVSITLRVDGLEPVFQAFCLISVLRNLHGVACWLVDSQIRLLRVSFPFEAPDYADAMQLMFPGAVLEFGAATACLQMDAAYLSMPVRRTENDLNEMLRRALYIMVKPYRRDRLMLRRVRQLLRTQIVSQSGHTAYTAQTLAQELHISVRSLHRFLQEEGTTLQAIKNEVRRERAVELLVRSRHPVKQIAGMAGFENVKSFARAFLRWTGKTPQQFRSEQHGLQQTRD